MCGFFDRFRKKKQPAPDAGLEIPAAAEELPADPMAPPDWLRVLTGLRTKDGHLYYVVKLENRGGMVMGEADVSVSVPEKLFRIKGLGAKFPHLDPGDTIKDKFLLHPRYRTGGGMVSGEVTYFDFEAQERMTFMLPQQKVNFFIPPLEPVRTDDDGWRLKTATLKRYEVETDELGAEPGDLFEVSREAVDGLGLFAVEPTVTPGLYRGVARYVGLAGRDLFGFEVQVIGKGGISRMLITALGPDDMKSRAMGFRVVEALSAKTHILDHIREPPGEGPEWGEGGDGGGNRGDANGAGGKDGPERDARARAGWAVSGNPPIGGVGTRGRKEWK